MPGSKKSPMAVLLVEASLTRQSPAPKHDGHHKVNNWHCTRCDRLLGVGRDGRMHLRFARGHEYLVGYPVQAICRDCATLNELGAPSMAPHQRPVQA